MNFERSAGRRADALRPVSILRHHTRHAEGSVLVNFGQTQVLCTASVEEKVPPHKRGSGQGWVTAEYGAITGAFVAAHDAVSWLLGQGRIARSPIRDFVAAVSVGKGRPSRGPRWNACWPWPSRASANWWPRRRRPWA